MKLLCSQCNKILKTLDQDDLTRLLHSDEGVCFFCSTDCKDKWVYPTAIEKESSKVYQTAS